MKDRPNILHCSDFSKESNSSLKLAAKMANLTKGKLHVLHVSELQIQWDWMLSHLELDKNERRGNLNILDPLKKRLHQVTSELKVDSVIEVLQGIPFNVIQQYVKENSIDFMFMGKRGHGNHFFPIGSLAQKMISTSLIPVFVVKNDLPINSVTGLIDPKGPAQKIAEMTEELSYLLGVKGRVLSVYKTIAGSFYGRPPISLSSADLDFSSDEKQLIAEEVRKYISQFFSQKNKIDIEVEFSVEKKISFFMNFLLKKDKSNLIIFQRHQKSFLEKIFLGEEARRMIDIFEGNMVVLPP